MTSNYFIYTLLRMVWLCGLCHVCTAFGSLSSRHWQNVCVSLGIPGGMQALLGAHRVNWSTFSIRNFTFDSPAFRSTLLALLGRMLEYTLAPNNRFPAFAEKGRTWNLCCTHNRIPIHAEIVYIYSSTVCSIIIIYKYSININNTWY